ncbi:hypothetical protein TRFO_22985 [Tritrichomonas foetus]|uniref:Uncharacterized protein n=1 Tax=Tritrichomonas foetus TaxID=1144522 RepID=A0A1J4KB79_9EUKA|nr:hypothetical protein TRFO_22985 [Tritrichomonas foetus]|eukprot:OHT08475.1 hypothetical protein TRFO_22985 [Tritrichomonas foetus]
MWNFQTIIHFLQGCCTTMLFLSTFGYIIYCGLIIGYEPEPCALYDDDIFRNEDRCVEYSFPSRYYQYYPGKAGSFYRISMAIVVLGTFLLACIIAYFILEAIIEPNSTLKLVSSILGIVSVVFWFGIFIAECCAIAWSSFSGVKSTRGANEVDDLVVRLRTWTSPDYYGIPNKIREKIESIDPKYYAYLGIPDYKLYTSLGNGEKVTKKKETRVDPNTGEEKEVWVIYREPDFEDRRDSTAYYTIFSEIVMPCVTFQGGGQCLAGWSEDKYIDFIDFRLNQIRKVESTLTDRYSKEENMNWKQQTQRQWNNIQKMLLYDFNTQMDDYDQLVYLLPYRVITLVFFGFQLIAAVILLLVTIFNFIFGKDQDKAGSE